MVQKKCLGTKYKKCCHYMGLKHQGCSFLKTISQAQSYSPVPCQALTMPQGKPCQGGDADPEFFSFLSRDKASKLRQCPIKCSGTPREGLLLGQCCLKQGHN